MIDRLDQLTLQKLIDLACGDINVLVGEGEKVNHAVLLKNASAILTEYKSIASPTQAKLDLADGEGASKLRIKGLCARICMILCKHNHPEMAREVLMELGIDAEHLDTDEKVLAHCQSLIGEVEFETKRIEERREKSKDKRKPVDARKSWYSEIAYVMSIFKMSIDPGTINAAIYANLVHQASERSKLLAKMPMGGLL
jgi:hypothetical protein